MTIKPVQLLRPGEWIKGVTSPCMNWWSLFFFLIAGLVSMPVLVVFGYIVVPAGELWRHLASTVLPEYVKSSLLLMAGVGTGTLIIGISTAWLCTMCRFPGRRIFEWALLLPMAIPGYIVAYTYAGMLEYAGPVQTAIRAVFVLSRGDYWFPDIRSPGGAIVVMSLVLYPYVYLLARSAFLGQSVCMLEVSRTLGLGAWRSFTDIAIPLARPAIIAGVSLALMETLSDYGTVQYYGVSTFTTGIFRTWFGLGNAAAAAKLSSILMMFILALILFEKWSRGSARFHHTSRRYSSLPGYRLSGVRGRVAFIACFMPLFFGFLLPSGQLVLWSVETAERMIDERFLTLTINSLSLAVITAVLAVILALIMVYILRLKSTPVMNLAARVASLGYGIPGTVLAVGVLLPFARLDSTIDAFLRSNLNISTGLLLSGTLIALVFAYLVRFLAVSFNTVEASMAKVTPTMDDASRTLGLSPVKTLLKVHTPIVKGGLLTAATLVFVDVMKELPATLIMRPFNFNTLAVRAFELASDERLADSASAALAIVLTGIIPVIILSIKIARSRPGHGGSEND